LPRAGGERGNETAESRNRWLMGIAFVLFFLLVQGCIATDQLREIKWAIRNHK